PGGSFDSAVRPSSNRTARGHSWLTEGQPLWLEGNPERPGEYWSSGRLIAAGRNRGRYGGAGGGNSRSGVDSAVKERKLPRQHLWGQPRHRRNSGRRAACRRRPDRRTHRGGSGSRSWLVRAVPPKRRGEDSEEGQRDLQDRYRQEVRQRP